jgi:gas vesicle protein
MTHDLNNPDQIEREIEKDREALRRTLDDLQGELSLDGLSRRLTGSVRKNGAEWAEAASDAARANPIALGLTGIGLAWMIFGRGHDPVHSFGQPSHNRSDRNEHYAAMASKPAQPYKSRPPFSRPAWASDDKQEADRNVDATSDRSIGSGKEHGMIDSAKDKSLHLRDRLSEGTEDMSEEARRRIEAARRKALDASDAVSRQMAQANRKIARNYDNEPLLFGALALLGGAALGTMLPGTRREDELLGDYREQLFDEAEKVYQEEKGRIGKAVSAGMDEAKSAASQVVSAAKEELTEGGNAKTASNAEVPVKPGKTKTTSESDQSGTISSSKA